MEYLVVGSCIFGVNLLPAFGPPTWAVLVFFRLNSDLAAVPLVLFGAVAAAAGRFVLASASAPYRARFSAERLESLQAAEDALVGSRGKALAGLGLFALSPLPSAQLFVAAGLLTVPLVPLRSPSSPAGWSRTRSTSARRRRPSTASAPCSRTVSRPRSGWPCRC